MLDELRNAPRIRSHDRQARGERFEHYVRHPLITRWKDEARRLVHLLENGAPWNSAVKHNTVVEAEPSRKPLKFALLRAGSENVEPEAGQRRQNANHMVGVLPTYEAAGKEDARETRRLGGRRGRGGIRHDPDPCFRDPPGANETPEIPRRNDDERRPSSDDRSHEADSTRLGPDVRALVRVNVQQAPAIVLGSLPCPVTDDLLDDRYTGQQCRLHVQAGGEHDVRLGVVDRAYDFTRSPQPGHRPWYANDGDRVDIHGAGVIRESDDRDRSTFLGEFLSKIWNRCSRTADVGRKDAGQDSDSNGSLHAACSFPGNAGIILASRLATPGLGVNLLLFNLCTDLADPTFGFTTSWINGLARRCNRVVVVTLRTGIVDVDANVSVYSLGSPSRMSRPRKVAEFYRVVLRALRTYRIDACFAHMTPHLAALFWPVARLYKIPVLLWYAHGAVPVSLRIAHQLVDRCITSTPTGFRLKSNKLFVLGQGIDTQIFVPPTLPGGEYNRTALTVGRLTPRKRLEQIIESMALLRRSGEDLRLVVAGGTATEADKRYESELRARVDDLSLDDSVKFEGAVPFPRIHGVYWRGAIFVNASETDSLDKAILESMASGCIPISRNRSFARIAQTEGLDFLVPAPGPEGIAERLAEVVALSATERVRLRRRLRELVVRDHSLDALMDKIRRHLEEIGSDASGPVGQVDLIESKPK
jgi:glycosyltransferase involved in cell wall biosynthesis